MLDDSKLISTSGKNILITGGNSGIGFHSVINFLRDANYLYVPIKSIKRKEEFENDLREYFSKQYLDKYLNIIEKIDFGDLKNICKVRDELTKKNIKLDILILNAGIQYTGALYPKVSKQGIELTFAVNHLAHFYLANILVPLIKDSFESKIVVTSSDVHNPKSSGGNIGAKADLNDLLTLKEEIMGDYVNFNSDKSYKNSKLCNILFAKELSKKLIKSNKKISVITWAPGLVIPEDDSGFFRYSSKFNKTGYKLFSLIAKNILGIYENVENAGQILYQIAIDPAYNKAEYLHLSNQLISFKKHKLLITNVSEEANDSDLASKLWELSEELCSSFGFKILDV